MRQHIVIFACLCSALVYALPVADNQDGLQIVQIPLSDNKELDILSVDSDGRLSERSKRTIGILRDLFPELTKQVEDQVNSIVAQIIRALGPTILRTAIQGTPNRARANFDADFDDDDDDTDSSSRVQIDLPSFNPDDDKDDDSNKTDSDNLNAGDNSIDLTALNEQLQETIRVARQAAANDNLITSGDQTAAESKSPAIDELTLEDDTADGDDRNKRFLPFGFGGSASASSGSASGGGNGGGGPGSGNFLFDIIRLFSGSVQSQPGDERANEPASSSEDTSNAGASAGAQADGYTEGIPGPVTRLVVLANRGLANLIQDLILRVAATSERLVNFKARLITSLI